jgi:pyruvate kinase
VATRVVVAGTVSDNKGINLPGVAVSVPALSEKDKEDLRFALHLTVDFIALSFVRSAKDVEDVRAIMDEEDVHVPVIAKIEKPQAIDKLDEIIKAFDGFMVARGDLGVECPLEDVPMIQAKVVDLARRNAKPVIVATQMLESMVEQPRPTRAEATDVANAVFDGADALMLSTETAAGRHPVEAVRSMARIIVEAEAWQLQGGAPTSVPRRRAADLAALAVGEGDIPEIVSAAAVHAAGNLGVRWIVAFSQGGFTARLIARHRPEAGILVFTTDARVARQVQLVWGVHPLVMEADLQSLDEVVHLVEARLLADGLASAGEAIVVLMGDPIRERPLTNLIRVGRIRPSAG